MFHNIILGAICFFVGGACTAASSKLLGWFNKQEKSVTSKLP